MILLFCRWELWGGVNVRPPLRPELEPLSPGAGPCVTLTSAATGMGQYLLENSRIDLHFNTKPTFYPRFFSIPNECFIPALLSSPPPKTVERLFTRGQSSLSESEWEVAAIYLSGLHSVSPLHHRLSSAQAPSSPAPTPRADHYSVSNRYNFSIVSLHINITVTLCSRLCMVNIKPQTSSSP